MRTRHTRKAAKMSNKMKLPYDKPELEFWSAESLNAIEATMSGGGGGGGRVKVASAPAPYQWFRTGTQISSTAIDLNNREFAVSVVLAIVAGTINPVAGTAVSIASAVVQYCINNNAETLYYRRTYFELDIDGAWGASSVPQWDFLGSATRTSFYTDSGRTLLAGETIQNDLGADEQYLVDYLRSYCGCWS